MKYCYYLIGAMLFLTIEANAQSPNSRPVNPKLSEASISRGPADADQYNYQEKRIFKVLVKQEIPADFPKYDSATMTAEQYDENCRRYLLQHLDLVKPEYHARLKDGK